ncbi:iron-sulfur cluster repair di-iron protein [Acetivibrio straminisolvens]|jgi:regulator of cell morphogenesis and NO signaling|uniref:Nitric oxide-dependent regulator DnrN or NorA n=1 Tax=Acetivibrio straminisolvens JCM 21531 TaxID=1294263 RepID=W4V1R0_9FIRM|nr:iron-sulfur cluster repair di-iron protein [Acetivibrio straminisolvens]GAE86743.1 nitric oxide-dependent regulator DnrN or NorA [Acetivibrio straminisolvens JCM 21531]
MNTFNRSQSIGEIVSIMPKASEVFKEFNIDFCCGGHRSLSEVIKAENIDEQQLLRRLEAAYEESKNISNQTNFMEMPSTKLIDYIVSTHHVLLRRILPELSELTTKILRVHGSNHPNLFRVHKLFHSLKTELEQHLIKEEEILFPVIKEFDSKPSNELLNRISAVMKETEDEHDAAGDILKELRKTTNDYSVPNDGCNTYCRAFDKLQELEADLFQHIHLENNILFRRFNTIQ